MTDPKKTEDAAPVAPLPMPTPEEVPLNVTRKVEDADKDGKADTSGPKTSVNVYEVLIERSNNEKIASEVFEFELPLLKKLHGEERVRYNEGEPAFEAEIDGDAYSVHKMLEGKYGSNLVLAVYPDADTFSTKSGVAKSKVRKGKAESENVDNRKKK